MTVSLGSSTREPIPNPGVTHDGRAITSEPARLAVGQQRIARRRGRVRGQPSADHLAIYADYISGKTFDALSVKYGYARTSLTPLIRRIDRWLIPQYMDDIRCIKCQHTQRLLHIVAEAMSAWERSKSDKVQFEFEKGDDGKLKLAKLKREPQVGNAKYLDTAMDALEQIRKIWGADAPVRMEVSGEIRVAGRTVEEARAELAEQMRQGITRLLSPANN